MQLFDHLLQKHVVLATDTVLIVLNKHLVNVLLSNSLRRSNTS